MKKCSNCFQMKDETQFYPKRIRRKDGTFLEARQSRCKACNAEVVAGYFQRAKERLRRRDTA